MGRPELDEPLTFGYDDLEFEPGKKSLRMAWVLVPLLAGVVIAGAMGAQMLWSGLPDRASGPTSVVCWDGTETDNPASCSEPSGVAGLEYVFPSFDADDPSCRQVVRPEKHGGQSTDFTCKVKLRKEPVRIAYRARVDFDAGMDYLEDKHRKADESTSSSGDRVVWRFPERRKSGKYELTTAYLAHPYIVTITAKSRETRDDALVELVRFRPAEFITIQSDS